MKKRLFALGAGLIVISGIAFGFSNKDLLRGDFTGTGIDFGIDFSDTVDVYDDATNQYYADLAQTWANEAQAHADTADNCATGLDAFSSWDMTLECSDTDGGIDYETYGETTGTSWYDGTEWDPAVDFCLDEDQVVEYWCIDDSSSIFDGFAAGAAYDCGDGYSCSDGACVADEAPECSDDSDCSDGYTCSDAGVCEEEELECSDNSDCNFGYSCSDDYVCEEVTPNTCEDSDDGINYYEEATASGTDYDDYDEVENQTEYCIDDDTLLEFWCPDSGTYEDYLYYEEFDCPDNYACQDGACVNILTSDDYECEDPFRDTDDEMVCRAYNAGIINGKSSTKYDPYAGITRAEVIKIIILTMGEDVLEYDQGILDMDESHWAWGYVNRAKDLGIITESTFNPDVEVTRGTTMVWLVRAAGETLPKEEWEDIIPWSDMTDDNPSTYAAMIGYLTEVDFLDEGTMSVVNGYTDGTFRPENGILRYEALYLTYRSYLAWFEDEGTFEDPDEE